jgi:predicted Zn-dependent protease
VFDNPHTSYRTLAGVERGAPLSAREVNAQWLARARNFVVDEPVHFLKALGYKVFALVHSYRRHDLVPAFSYDWRFPVPLVPFAAIAFAAVAGVALDHRRWRQWLIPAAIGANQVLVMLLVYVSDRQRVALLPFAACLAAVGVARLAALAPRRRVGAAAALLVLGAAFSIPTARMRDYTYLWRNASIADAAWVEALVKRNAGDVDGARRASAVALAHAPWLPTFSRPAEIRVGGDSALARIALTVRSWGSSSSELFDRATLLRLARDHDAAARLQAVLAERGARLDRQYLQSSDPRYYLARDAVRRGARDEARALLAQVLRDAPGDPFALALLAVLEPRATHEQTLTRYFGPADAHYLIGVAGLLANDPLHAASRFEALAPFIPDSRQRQLLLAAAYSRAGKAEHSVRAFETAMIPGSEPVWFEQEVLTAYDTLLAQRPDDPQLTEGFLRALETFGRDSPRGGPRVAP